MTPGSLLCAGFLIGWGSYWLLTKLMGRTIAREWGDIAEAWRQKAEDERQFQEQIRDAKAVLEEHVAE